MTRIILHVAEANDDGVIGWWADGPDHNFTAAGDSMAEVKDLAREACAMERWGDPEWELCPCANFGECTA